MKANKLHIRRRTTQHSIRRMNPGEFMRKGCQAGPSIPMRNPWGQCYNHALHLHRQPQNKNEGSAWGCPFQKEMECPRGMPASSSNSRGHPRCFYKVNWDSMTIKLNHCCFHVKNTYITFHFFSFQIVLIHLLHTVYAVFRWYFV